MRRYSVIGLPRPTSARMIHRAVCRSAPNSGEEAVGTSRGTESSKPFPSNKELPANLFSGASRPDLPAEQRHHPVIQNVVVLYNDVR